MPVVPDEFISPRGATAPSDNWGTLLGSEAPFGEILPAEGIPPFERNSHFSL
jgi:hypothetical protein